MKKDRGLGDTIERFTDATGISKVVKAVTKKCGCKKRKNKLNQLFSYKDEIDIEEFEKKTPMQRLENYLKKIG